MPKQLSLLGQSLLKCDEKEVSTARILMKQYKVYSNTQLSNIQEDDLVLDESQDDKKVKNVISPSTNNKNSEQKTIESLDPLTKNLVEQANSIQEARQQKLPQVPNSQLDQATTVVKDNPKLDLLPKDPNLVLAEKLVKDLEKLVGNQSSSQEKNDFLELIKDTKGSNTQIIFEDRKALDQFQSSYYMKSADLSLQDVNKIVVDNSDAQLQQAIEKNLAVIKKLSARQELKIEAELKDLVQSMQAVDPKFYDKVKIPKSPPSLEASQEKVQEYNVAMRSEKSQEIHKKIKRAFKSAKAKVSSIGSAVSNKVTEFKEGAKKTGQEWKEKVKNQINTWRGR